VEELESALQIWHRARAAEGREPKDARVERVRAKLSDPSSVTALVERRAQFVGMGVAEPFREHLGLGEPRPGWGHITMVFVDDLANEAQTPAGTRSASTLDPSSVSALTHVSRRARGCMSPWVSEFWGRLAPEPGGRRRRAWRRRCAVARRAPLPARGSRRLSWCTGGAGARCGPLAGGSHGG